MQAGFFLGYLEITANLSRFGVNFGTATTLNTSVVSHSTATEVVAAFSLQHFTSTAKMGAEVIESVQAAIQCGHVALAQGFISAAYLCVVVIETAATTPLCAGFGVHDLALAAFLDVVVVGAATSATVCATSRGFVIKLVITADLGVG